MTIRTARGRVLTGMKTPERPSGQNADHIRLGVCRQTNGSDRDLLAPEEAGLFSVLRKWGQHG